MKDNMWQTSKGDITSAQVEAWIKKIEEMINKDAIETLGVDGDNDLPISFSIINRIKYQPCHSFLIEHRHLIETKEEEMERLDYLFTNAAMGFDDLRTEMRIMRFHRADKKENKEKNNG